MLTEHICKDRDQAGDSAAGRIAASLTRDLGSNAEAAIVVSGGTTPRGCLERLAVTDLPWNRVHVLPSDERWVPAGHTDSNETMVRNSLLVKRAAAATFHSLYREAGTAEDHCGTLAKEIASLPLPFSSVLLGMGEDGHFASLFPDFAGLAEGLDVDSNEPCLAVRTSGSPYQRMTLTLATLVRSREIVLLIFGVQKRTVIDASKRRPDAYPIGRLLHQSRVPVHAIWAP